MAGADDGARERTRAGDEGGRDPAGPAGQDGPERTAGPDRTAGSVGGSVAVAAAPPAQHHDEHGPRRLRRWLLEDEPGHASRHLGPHSTRERGHRWWQVMCLTGVDYFSTLGYQPGIAALAAGSLAPVATLVLIVVTLLGALPVYRRVARESPRGEGSIAMLERLLSWWPGKILVLVLLGFAATDFLITMTLSAADASAHVVENPLVPSFLHGQNLVITLVLLALLAVVFLRGFSEAVGIAVVLVGVYLVLNAVVAVDAVVHVLGRPQLVVRWQDLLVSQHPNPALLIAMALIIFPKLALGLSGFETGVAVMPLVRGKPDDDPARPEARIAGARKLLLTSAVIMSCFLVLTSFATTVLIPAKEFQPGGGANGRAVAYLAHEFLGPVFGTAYDLSTVAILWFAGASAMAGLLNLVPRYLPRYGMAPHWTRAVRPLVLVFVVVAFVVTILFKADVDAQGGAYATGVLVLITSAALAVTLSCVRRRQQGRAIGFGVVTAVFVYTTGANVVERTEGVKIAAFFIAGILLVSLLSRALRAFELRVSGVSLDVTAQRFLDELQGELGEHGEIRIIANEPDDRAEREYREKEAEERLDQHIPGEDPVLFAEVTVVDSSDFEHELVVRGEERYGYRVLRMEAATIPNALAALLLHVRDTTGRIPHIYFEWTEGNPIGHLLRYLIAGDGEVAPVAREVLREAEPDRQRRPHVHVV